MYKLEPELLPDNIAPVSTLNVPLNVKPPVTRPSTYPFEAASVEAETVSIPWIRPVPLKTISPPPTVKSPVILTSFGKPTVIVSPDSLTVVSPLTPSMLTKSVEPSLPSKFILAVFVPALELNV